MSVRASVFIFMFVSLAGQAAELCQKPVRQVESYIDFQPPPRELTEMVTSADAIVRGVLVSAESKEVAGVGGIRRLVTEYTFVVQHPLKADAGTPATGMKLVVTALGGEIDRGDYIERQRDKNARFPEHLKGEYVVFLKWNDAFKTYVFQYGPGGIFENASGRVEAYGTEGAPNKLKGRDWADFIRNVAGLTHP